VSFGLKTWSSQDIQISSLNVFLSLPPPNHLCNIFPFFFSINSEPCAMKSHPSVALLKFSSYSQLLSQAVSLFSCFGIYHSPNGLPNAEKMMKNTLFWLSEYDLTTFPCSWSERRPDIAPASHMWGIWLYSDCIRSIRNCVMCLDRFSNCHTNILKIIYPCVRSDTSKTTL